MFHSRLRRPCLQRWGSAAVSADGCDAVEGSDHDDLRRRQRASHACAGNGAQGQQMPSGDAIYQYELTSGNMYSGSSSTPVTSMRRC
ncbi:MAG: hypothetical protein ACLVJ6_08245 [Merdibacter sp.]